MLHLTLDEAVAMIESAQRAEEEGLEENGPFPVRRTVQKILDARPTPTDPLLAGADSLAPFMVDCAVIIHGFRYAVKDLTALDRARLILALESL